MRDVQGSVFYRRFSFCAAILTALALVAAPLAPAQSPAAVYEYIAQPPGGGLDGSSGGGEGGGGAGGKSGGSAPGAAGGEAVTGGAGGSLPFTGYPLISLAWIALTLVALALCIRLSAAGYRRLRSAGPTVS